MSEGAVITPSEPGALSDRHEPTAFSSIADLCYHGLIDRWRDQGVSTSIGFRNARSKGVRRGGVMTRRLSIAMAFSATIHIVAFLVVDYFLGFTAIPDVVSTPLQVTIDSQNLSVYPAPDPPTSPPAQKTKAIVEETAAAINTPGEDPAASQSATAIKPIVSDPVAASTETERFGESTGPKPTNTVVVTDGANADWSVSAKVKLSARQQKMLNRKIRKWTEELYKMHDLAAGVTWNFDGQEYVARFSEVPADDDMNIERVLVEISTIKDGQRLSSELQLKRLAFSNFAQFVNRWDPDVEIHDDELDGRFHANSEINLTYDSRVRPVFHGRVTTTARSIDISRVRGPRRRNQIFLGGLETGVRAIPLPRDIAPMLDYLDADDVDVHHLTDDTRIIFRPDGSFVRQEIGSVSPAQLGRLSTDTTYFIADKKASIHVSGTVNGKVLVYSPERIVVEDNLVYEQDPEDVPEADDFVGLVSDKFVDVAPADVTGPGDLLINAAIFAKRRFAVRKVNFGEHALLYLYGSLSAGSLSATEPRYSTRIRFDRRLEELRPPGFPTTNRYEVESWDADWTVNSIH